MLLSIDRSTASASAALFERATARLIASVCLPANGTGDAFELIEEVFSKANASVSQLSEIAVGIGPGSFSGIRSALALAFGLSLPADRTLPVRGVLTPAAMVRRYRRMQAAESGAQHHPVYVLGDARRSHIWCFAEPSDFASLSHSTQDLRLYRYPEVAAAPENAAEEKAIYASRALSPIEELFSEKPAIYLAADPERLQKIFSDPRIMGLGIALTSAPAEALAEDIAAFALANQTGEPSPVYLHPAVVGSVISSI